jgi:hypothetical protein
MNKNTLRQIITALTVIVVITMNILANAIPFNGKNTGEISDAFKVLFVPAGYVFSIWGLIYIGLIAYGIFQMLPFQRDNPRLKAIFWPFVIGQLANIAWLFAWHYGIFWLTVILMLVLLASLMIIYLRLNVNRVKVVSGERWMVHLPFSVYLGWISVATIANISDVIWYYAMRPAGSTTFLGIPEVTWTVIMLIIAALLGFLMAFFRRDIAFILVLAWAFAGIAVRQAENPSVQTTAWVAAGLMAVAVVFALLYRPRWSRLSRERI